MDKQIDSSALLTAAGIGRGSCVALIGAGGKTTIMLSLAAAARKAGLRTIVTTTTKIWPPSELRLICAATLSDVQDALSSCLAHEAIVALGDHIGPEGKVHGVSPELVCGLHEQQTSDLILCEADGAAGRSLKVHRPGEPVVPSCSTIALVVAGMDALGQPVRSSAHRVEEFCRLTGTRPDDRIEPDHIASALEAAASYAPPSARTTYVLNKVDGLAWADAAATLASAVHSREPHRAILLTQRGRVADAFRPGESRSSLHSQTAPRTLYS